MYYVATRNAKCPPRLHPRLPTKAVKVTHNTEIHACFSGLGADHDFDPAFGSMPPRLPRKAAKVTHNTVIHACFNGLGADQRLWASSTSP